MTPREEAARERARKLLEVDPEYYSRIGKIGGSRCVPKGYSMNRKLAKQSAQAGNETKWAAVKAEATKQRGIA